MFRHRKFIAAASVAALCSTALAVSPMAASAKTLAPIKIGLITQETGSGAFLPTYRAVATATVNAQNKAGGINGHKVQLVVCDGQNDPNIELTCAHNLISDGVVAEIGGQFQYQGGTNDQLLAAAGIPEINGPDPTSTTALTSPYSFIDSNAKVGGYLASLMQLKAQHVTSIYIEAIAISVAAVSVGLVRQGAAFLGITVKGETDIPTTASNYTPYAQAALSSGAGAAFGVVPATIALPLISAFDQLGQTMTLTGSVIGLLSHSQLAALGGKEVDHIEGGLAIPPPSATKLFPALKTFNAQMKTLCSTGNQYACPTWVDTDQDVSEWLAYQAFFKIAAKLKTVTAGSVLHALKTVKNVNMDGLIPPWTPNKTGPVSVYPRINVFAFYGGIIKNGFAYLTSNKILNTEPITAAAYG